VGIFLFTQEGSVRLTTMKLWVTTMVLSIGLATGIALVSPSQAPAQEQPKGDELPRKARLRVEPVYPEIARRMNIAGTVRLAVVVAPNGSVKSSKPIGGHPLLVNAATEAVKRWRFEPGPGDSNGIVEFKFHPQD
jgi:TonB family protein